MLKYYLEKISECEFTERDIEIPKLVNALKNTASAKGTFQSSHTLQVIAEFFAAEFVARCDFLKNFICTHANLFTKNIDHDIATNAKEEFQNYSLPEIEKIKNFYNDSVKPIGKNLSNDTMKKNIEQELINKMNACIRKNNLYIELTFMKITVTESNPPVTLLQPNFYGLGVDLRELWNRYLGRLFRES